METKQFQAETKQILQLMAHSLYTHRHIFLRELISNASDALDKLRLERLTAEKKDDGEELFIELKIDKENRTLTVKDNGIGMSKDEVIENIGTIARSGTGEFLKRLEQEQAGDLIGQFGVGFYSAFMVAAKVVLLTRKEGESGVKWESRGEGTYTIEECEKQDRGTEVILHMKPVRDDEEDFLDQFVIKDLVKKYSDFIRYPIKMEMELKEYPKDEEGKVKGDAQPITKKEVQVLNSMKPLWTRPKTELKEEDYYEFYKSQFHDWTDPLEVLHFTVEGQVEFTGLLFFPAKAPFDILHPDYKPGLKLFSRNVLIMDEAADILPDYFRFVRGVIDSPDFTLNISRETLQQNSQYTIVKRNLTRKIGEALKKMLENDREKYSGFWNEFGTAIKAGLYQNPDSIDDVKELLVFHSSKESDNPVSLNEYVSRAPASQKKIFYAASDDIQKVEALPQLETFKEKGIEVLYFIDRVDEFLVSVLREFEGKQFQSILQEGVEVDGQKRETEKKEKELSKFLEYVKERLKEKVEDVKVSSLLKSAPVGLVTGKDGISIQMEEMMKQMGQGLFKAKRILEINPDHQLIKQLVEQFEQDKDSSELSEKVELLYDQALLYQGIQVPDTRSLADRISRLLAAK